MQTYTILTPGHPDMSFSLKGLGSIAPSVAAAHPVSNSLLMDRLMEARVSDQWLNSCSWLIVWFQTWKITIISGNPDQENDVLKMS